MPFGEKKYILPTEERWISIEHNVTQLSTQRDASNTFQWHFLDTVANYTRVIYLGFSSTSPQDQPCPSTYKWSKVLPLCYPCKVGWIIISFLLTTWDFVAVLLLRNKGIAVEWCLCIHKIVATFTRGPYSAYSIFTIAFCWGTHACKRTIRAARTKCTQECSPESGCGSRRYQCLCDGSCGFSCVGIG